MKDSRMASGVSATFQRPATAHLQQHVKSNETSRKFRDRRYTHILNLHNLQVS